MRVVVIAPLLLGCGVLFGCGVLLGCGSAEVVEVRGAVRSGRTGRPLAGARLERANGQPVELDSTGAFVLSIKTGSVLHASAPGSCPREVEVEVDRGQALVLHLFPRLEVEEAFIQVGFDREVEILARTRCDPEAPLRWEQLSGPELGPRLRIQDGGRKLGLRTHRLEELVHLDPRIGVVPFTRRERGDYRLRLRAELGGHEEVRDVRVTAGPTATGVFQVATGADVYFNGGAREAHRWELVAKPDDSEAELHGENTRTPHFRPDRFGQYLIRHEPTALTINIQAGSHEDVPRDCGREGCHQPEDEGWKATAHASAFRRGLVGDLGPSFAKPCWSCHATGVDIGVENGGLHRTARRFQYVQAVPHAEAWEEAPRQIRRHGSVWCSACHGPGRILPSQFHWEYEAKFRASVCATCHDVVDDPDSPHQSWQYREWTAAKMSSFVGGGDDPGPAIRPECASCHSAQGFVAAVRGRRHTPELGTAEPITCTACHDPHDGSLPSALRIHGTVEDLGGRRVEGLGTGAICASCHRAGGAHAEDPTKAPHAPQADLLLGRGSLLVRGRKPGVHSALDNSCVACHMALPRSASDRGRVGGHTFLVRARDTAAPASSACVACHGSAVPPQAIGGIRDWDADGRSGRISEEFDQALAAAQAAVAERISRTGVRDECDEERAAAGYRTVDARLLLVDAQGRLLGDCNSDGLFEGREEPAGMGRLAPPLRKIVWDVALLEADGSRAQHNPSYSFAILRAIRRALID